MHKLSQYLRPVAARLHANHMQRLGIAKTMRLAAAYNRLRWKPQQAARTRLYHEQFAELLLENGGTTRPPLAMQDGWALDGTRTLPHLDRVLADAEKIIAERAGQRRSASGAYRSYFQDVWTPEDAVRYPSFLDFATSSDLLRTVADYLGCLPALSTTLPAGIRFVESNALFDDRPDTPHDSQLYHIDYYSLPNVYVLVLLRDTTAKNGPWTFLPKALSQRTAARVNNWGRGQGYRFSDEEIHAVAPEKERIEFCGPAGSVLFIESSGCFHYGSRNCVEPRFQLMLGYGGAVRTDFSELIMTAKVYPQRPEDSRLRRWVLDKEYCG